MSLRHRRNQIENLMDQLESILQQLPHTERPRDERERPSWDFSGLHEAELKRFRQLYERAVVQKHEESSRRREARGIHRPGNEDCDCGTCQPVLTKSLSEQEEMELEFYLECAAEGTAPADAARIGRPEVGEKP